MKKEDYRDIFSVVAGLLTAVLSVNVQNAFMKITFIICYVVGYILFLKYLKDGVKWKKYIFVVLFAADGAILAISFVNVGSLKNYIIRLGEFFESEQEQEKEERADGGGSEEIAGWALETNQRIAAMNENLTAVNENISQLSDDVEAYQFIRSKEDQTEIDKVVQVIRDKYNDNSSYFPDLKTNKHDVELFYKMQLSEEAYYYCNIIKALEAYGIDCGQMSVNEYDLMLWDIEVLYAKYNMKESIQENLNKDISYEEKVFRYDDFKISMSEYSDILNYDDWRYTPKNVTAEEINELLNGRIMNYYTKFHMNFSENID
ncbi:MAG: hypothetical protein K1W25_12620 [Lachnospiraceae bacterium]